MLQEESVMLVLHNLVLVVAEGLQEHHSSAAQDIGLVVAVVGHHPGMLGTAVELAKLN